MTILCPLCGWEGVHAIRRGQRDTLRAGVARDLLRCPSCGIVFTSGGGSLQDYPTGYDPHQFADETRHPGKIEERYLLWLKSIYEHGPKPGGRLLDVGSGTGSWMRVWSRWQRECVGVDPHRPTAEEARRRGIDVRPGTLEEQRFPDASFDVVTFCHALEHLPDPRTALRESHRILRTGGQLVIWVPDFESVLRPVFGASWQPYEVPRHLWHFTRRTLARLVREEGFAPHDLLSAPNDYSLKASSSLCGNRLARTLSKLPFRMMLAIGCAGIRRADVLRLRATKAERPPIRPGFGKEHELMRMDAVPK